MLKYFVIILCLINGGLMFASHTPDHSDEYVFKHLTLADGLSQSSIFCIQQDRTGYIWIGTNDGLNRFDGYHFKIFKTNAKDSTTISDPATTALYEDRDGYLWIGTKRGILDKYDNTTGVFTHYEVNSDIRNSALLSYPEPNFPIIFARNQSWTITSIAEDAEGRLWIGTWGAGLILFDKETGRSKRFMNINNNRRSLSFDRITDILITDSNDIWVSTLGGGINRVESIIEDHTYSEGEPTLPLTIEFRTVSIPDFPDAMMRSVSLFVDNQQTLWIGTMNNGVFSFRLDAVKDSYVSQYLQYSEKEKNSLNCNMVMDITSDKNNKYIWFATFGSGVNRFDKETETFSYYKSEATEVNELMEDDFISLFIDHSGILWAGGHLGYGISKFEKNMVKFNHIKRNTKNNAGLNDDVIWAFYEDVDGLLWIGTYRGGINVYNPESKRFAYYPPDENDNNSIAGAHVRSLAGDPYGNIWIGTFSEELNMYNKSEKKFHRYISTTDGSNRYICENCENTNKIGLDHLKSPHGLKVSQIQSLLIDSDTLLWVGTYGGGIHVLNPKSAERIIPFKKYIKDPLNPFALSDNRVYALCEDRDKNIWVGTFGGGLNKFDKKTERFFSYKHDPADSNTISDNKVLSVFQDSKKRLWIGTAGGGLNEFIQPSNCFIRHGENIGLSSNVVYGILEGNNNDLWISTDNGIVKYNPDSSSIVYYDLYDGLQSKEFSGGAYMKSREGKCYFGGINGFNFFDPDSISVNTVMPPVVITEIRVLNEPISGYTNNMQFDYDENFITFQFAALDYTNPKENHYAFMLEGINKDWQYVSANQRTVNYTELPPGKYTFRVIGSNNDGIWNTKGAVFTFTILAPFWQTWWFISALIIFILGLTIYFVSVPVLNVIAIEKLKSKLAADLHDNIGAGLTEISILCELANKESEEGKKTNTLDKIGSTARRLIDSMSDIVWMVNPKNDSMYELILRLKTSYEEICSHMGIKFQTGDLQRLEKIKLPLDYRQNLFLLFKEAINNALKHSYCNILTLDVHLRGKTLAISLRDNGRGFSQDKKCYGNGLKNMKERAQRAGGNFTFSSAKNEGTTITFTGKVVKSPIGMYFNNRKFSAIS